MAFGSVDRRSIQLSYGRPPCKGSVRFGMDAGPLRQRDVRLIVGAVGITFSPLPAARAGPRARARLLTGAVVRLGREAGVETPVNLWIYRALLPSELRARGQLEWPEE